MNKPAYPRGKAYCNLRTGTPERVVYGFKVHQKSTLQKYLKEIGLDDGKIDQLTKLLFSEVEHCQMIDSSPVKPEQIGQIIVSAYVSKVYRKSVGSMESTLQKYRLEIGLDDVKLDQLTKWLISEVERCQMIDFSPAKPQQQKQALGQYIKSLEHLTAVFSDSQNLPPVIVGLLSEDDRITQATITDRQLAIELARRLAVARQVQKQIEPLKGKAGKHGNTDQYKLLERLAEQIRLYCCFEAAGSKVDDITLKAAAEILNKLFGMELNERPDKIRKTLKMAEIEK
ncbi:MAG: hypothetical protein RBQ99_05995 [Trichlorobacter sp.]|nr:hypothetical protein [Trichlorobacter sp.]